MRTFSIFLIVLLVCSSLLSSEIGYSVSELSENDLGNESAQNVTIVDTYVIWNFSVQDINIEKKVADVNIYVRVEDFRGNASQVNFKLLRYEYFEQGDYEYVTIPCYPFESQKGANYTNFEGNVTNIQWTLIGNGEIYPFDYYNLEFRLAYFIIDVENGTNPHAIDSFIHYGTMNLNLPDRALFLSKWEITRFTIPAFIFSIQRKPLLPTLQLLVPLFLCYVLLGFSFFLFGEEKLRERLTIYLGFFILSPTFFFAIQPFMPSSRVSLAIPEFLLTNLMASTAIYTIASVIPSSNRGWRTRNRIDAFSVLIPMLLFSFFYIISIRLLYLHDVELATLWGGFDVLLALDLTLIFFIISYAIGFFVIRFRDRTLNEKKGKTDEFIV